MWTNLEALPRTKYFLRFQGCDVLKCVHKARVAGSSKWCKSSRAGRTACYHISHQEISATIHWEATARGIMPKIAFIFKDQFQNFPLLILALLSPPPPPLK